MTVPVEHAPKSRFGVLRSIALYKLVKVILLLLVAYGELRLRDASLAAKLLSWAQARPYGLEHRIIAQIAGVVQRSLRVARSLVSDCDPGLCGRFLGRGHRLVDGEALGGVVDDHHHGLADSTGGLGNSHAADDRQDFDPARQCRRRRLPGVACP